jgi:hypothetical protein
VLIYMEEHFSGKEGIIWQVGSGQLVNIWCDPLPRGTSTTRRPITPKGRNIIKMVDELIEPATESWDVPLLSQIFWDEDVQH